MKASPSVENAHAPLFELECVTEPVRLRALGAQWRELHAQCRGVTPFNSWEWLFSWWQAYGSGLRLRLLSWRADGVLIAVAPLCIVDERTTLGTRCSVLKLLGDGTFDSDYLDFVILPTMHAAVMESFDQWLHGNREWDAAVLPELPESWPLVCLFRDHARRFRLECRTDYRSSGMLELPDSFEEYLRRLQPRFRTKLRSLLRRLDDGELVFESGCEPRELRRRLRSLFALHQKRWHASGEPGVFGGAAKRRFYAHFVPRFARRGWLRLYSLRAGDAYVAHQLCFGGEGTTFLLQEGFDTSNAAASYGQMLRAAVIRELIGAGDLRYDFLGGFSRHKADWGAREGKNVQITVGRLRWRTWLYLSLPLWRGRLAATAKRVLPAPIFERLRRMFSSS